MKAVIQNRYGDPDHLTIGEVPNPTPKEGEILVRIMASAVNDYDWAMVRGKPWIYRLMFGLGSPKNQIPGMEMAGIVAELGSQTIKWQEGDRVYADTSDHKFGTFAEYITLPEEALTKIPEKLSFEEAAATPHAALLAVQAFQMTDLKKNSTVLINGAGGGVGAFALKWAKQYDAHATGVDSGEKLKAMKDLGYDEVLNYEKQDFTKTGKTYDIIIDAKTNRHFWHYLRALAQNGHYITVGGHLPKLFQIALCSYLLKPFTKKRVSVLALKPGQGLENLHDLLNNGALGVGLDQPLTLEETPKAIARFGAAKHTGKVVVTISPS